MVVVVSGGRLRRIGGWLAWLARFSSSIVGSGGWIGLVVDARK